MIETFLTVLTGPKADIRGEAVFTTPGTYNWVVPAGVTSISVVLVGGGGATMTAAIHPPLGLLLAEAKNLRGHMVARVGFQAGILVVVLAELGAGTQDSLVTHAAAVAQEDTPVTVAQEETKPLGLRRGQVVPAAAVMAILAAVRQAAAAGLVCLGRG